MAKEIIKDKDVVMANHALKSPVKLAQRLAQLQEALKIPNLGADKKKEFEERIALIVKALK